MSKNRTATTMTVLRHGRKCLRCSTRCCLYVYAYVRVGGCIIFFFLLLFSLAFPLRNPPRKLMRLKRHYDYVQLLTITQTAKKKPNYPPLINKTARSLLRNCLYSSSFHTRVFFSFFAYLGYLSARSAGRTPIVHDYLRSQIPRNVYSRGK